jgi:hypothetical protein
LRNSEKIEKVVENENLKIPENVKKTNGGDNSETIRLILVAIAVFVITKFLLS